MAAKSLAGSDGMIAMKGKVAPDPGVMACDQPSLSACIAFFRLRLNAKNDLIY
jgi:hypothetical protein